MAGQEEKASSCAREVEAGHEKEALEQAAQGGGGVAGHGTYLHLQLTRWFSQRLMSSFLTLTIL